MLGGVFERFSVRARHVVTESQEEARKLRHDYVGSEHLLLGLLAEHDGLASAVLRSLGITLERARRQVIEMVGTGETDSPPAIPFTPRSKRILELALPEALALHHDYIGDEHLLLGLIREQEAVSGRMLLAFDASPQKIRTAALAMIPRATEDA